MSVEYATSPTAESSYFYVKGALEAIIEKSMYIYTPEGNIIDLSNDYIDFLATTEQKVSSLGYRVLAFAYGSEIDKLVFCGMIAMYDPPRRGCHDTIQDMIQMGIRVIMITGDSLGTATSIAQQVGLPTSHAFSGAELDKMSEGQLMEAVHYGSVFYRTTPTHKLSIVKSLQSAGNIVAMTGDGGNGV
jgi:Ca2+-transporting ATPase